LVMPRSSRATARSSATADNPRGRNEVRPLELSVVSYFDGGTILPEAISFLIALTFLVK
jgi:hypothetical protein